MMDTIEEKTLEPIEIFLVDPSVNEIVGHCDGCLDSAVEWFDENFNDQVPLEEQNNQLDVEVYLADPKVKKLMKQESRTETDIREWFLRQADLKEKYQLTWFEAIEIMRLTDRYVLDHLN